MTKGPRALPAFLVFGLLGLALAAADFGRLARFPVDRLAELRKFPPTPRSVLWIESLRGPLSLTSDLERVLVGLTLLLLIGSLLMLGAVLSPRFQLLKPADENPGSGMASHVDISQMLRIGAACLATLWMLGALAPVGLLLNSGKPGALSQALGGLPAWAGSESLGGLLILSLIAAPTIWWLWGPRGPIFPAPGVTLAEVLATGFFAAGAAVPWLLMVYTAREWPIAAGFAYSVADRAGWAQLVSMTLALPVLGCLGLAATAFIFRPAPLSSGRTIAMALVALVGIAGGLAVERQGRVALERLDVAAPSLAQRFDLQKSGLQRYALIMTPERRVAFGVTADDLSDGPEDQITSHPEARKAVEDFLARKNYRTTLAFRAFSYLNGREALDWQSTRSLRLELAMLEKAPSPIVSQMLMEKLGNCATSPENRAILDRIADPNAFVWPEAEGRRRLGAAYLRFGDLKKAREYLLKAQLNPQESREILGGVQPLANGLIRGRLTVQGAKQAGVRVGLLNAGAWPAMAGLQRPFTWGVVLDATHTDAEGRYEFRNVPQGQYVLLITGGGVGTNKGRAAVDRNPGVIELNRFQPKVELPDINMRFERPTGVPLGVDPNITA